MSDFGGGEDNGFSIIDFLGGVSDFLGSVWDGIVALEGYVVLVYNKLWSAMKLLGVSFVKFLNYVWKDITDLIGRAVGQLRKLAGAVGGLVPKILKALQTARDWIDRIYERFLRPMLILIQHIRQMLVYLRLFHIAFAAKLDKYLATLQSDIAKPFLLIRSTINGVIDVLQMIVDPRGILMSGPLLWSVWRDLGQLAGMLHLAGMSGVSVADRAQQTHYTGYFAQTAQTARAKDNARGIMDPYQIEQKQAMDAALRANG